MDQVIAVINDIIWSNALIFLCIGCGLYFSFKTKFLQITQLREMASLLFKEGESEKGVSPFQAFSIAVAGRVGVGNIAGVATAIAMGGPGAIFWMWVIAFLGSASAFIESTLSQIYKVEKNGEYRGGPAFYIEKGLGKRWYALIFAVVTIVSCSIFLPGIQSNSIAVSMNNAFDIPSSYSGIAICLLLVFTVFGGVKKIGRIAQIIVPLMAILYILMAVVIICMNIELVPEVFGLIFKSAFNLEASLSGMFGAALAWGVKRGIYSNEAGQGTAPHASAAAETSHPAKQGLVQAFSVYIDTLLVCTATALMILFTQQYNIMGPDGTYIVEHLPGVEAGPEFTSRAISLHFPWFGTEFIAVSLAFFAFTTTMAYCYIADSNFNYLTKKRNPILLWTMRLAILACVFYGSVNTAATVWALGDIGVGAMAWLNLVAIVLLRKPALIAFKDYFEQKKSGVNPTFDPDKLGIKNTSCWPQEKQNEK